MFEELSVRFLDELWFCRKIVQCLPIVTEEDEDEDGLRIADTGDDSFEPVSTSIHEPLPLEPPSHPSRSSQSTGSLCWRAASHQPLVCTWHCIYFSATLPEVTDTCALVLGAMEIFDIVVASSCPLIS